jgi:hypothetical protein
MASSMPKDCTPGVGLGAALGRDRLPLRSDRETAPMLLAGHRVLPEGHFVLERVVGAKGFEPSTS